MTGFFLVMIYITTIISGTVMIIFFGSILTNKNNITTQVYESCKPQLKACEVCSVVFAFLYWFAVSSLTQTECVKCYKKLSNAGAWIGGAWIVLAILDIVFSIYVSIRKKDTEAMNVMGRLRYSCFVMGAVFLIISFLLNVN